MQTGLARIGLLQEFLVSGGRGHDIRVCRADEAVRRRRYQRRVRRVQLFGYHFPASNRARGRADIVLLGHPRGREDNHSSRVAV
eukprot:9271589-Pyramimonas_sp.AAC.1